MEKIKNFLNKKLKYKPDFVAAGFVEKMSAVNKEVHLLFANLKKAYHSDPLIEL